MVTRVLAEIAGDLLDLVLPAGCPGCGTTPGGRPLCAACDGVLSAAVPGTVRPTPPPAGFPPCAALGWYDGVLRAALLQYKERGRHSLAPPLGRRLAAVVRAVVPGHAPVLLVPVPATAAAARRRHGDHMARLARGAARALRTAGDPAGVAYPLRTRPRPDSAGLNSRERAVIAGSALVSRAGAVSAIRRAVLSGVQIILVDDVVTTGATLATAATRLRAAGVPVTAAAVLAATRRRAGPSG